MEKLFYFWQAKIYDMNKYWILIIVLILVSCQQDKIGYVDTVRLMDNSNEKNDIESKYQLKSTALNKKRDSISQALQIEAQALQTKVQSMSQTKAQEEYELFQQKSQFMGQQLQQEEQLLQYQGQTEMDSLVSRVRVQISDFGKAKGYTYILSGGEGGSVLFGDDQQDLTDEILKIVNDSYEK